MDPSAANHGVPAKQRREAVLKALAVAVAQP